MSTFYGDNLTPAIVDANFPLQTPDGIAQRIKNLLSEGQIEEAEFLFTNLRAIDQGIVEHKADELLETHEFSPRNLDVLRALRLGIQAGMQIGRQEGAFVVSEVSGNPPIIGTEATNG